MCLFHWIKIEMSKMNLVRSLESHVHSAFEMTLSFRLFLKCSAVTCSVKCMAEKDQLRCRIYGWEHCFISCNRGNYL